jgi:phenylalanyl-tRNA synthetase alpha chain
VNTSNETTNQINNIFAEVQDGIGSADSLEALEQIRVRFLGKRGKLTDLAREIGGEKDIEKRKAIGRAVNQAVKQVEQWLGERQSALGTELSLRQGARALDVTLPGVRTCPGRLHPITGTIEAMKSIFLGLGFAYDDYPEIESEYYNFDALNTPAWHPARDMHDTFYTEDNHVLRTHTSAFQVRAMLKYGKPPIRAITSGRCYRNDEIDASHLPTFHQFDGIAVDQGISFADLKWTLFEMSRQLFGSQTEVRFRPSYFPFTTPSAEVDVSCFICAGKGCSLCSRTGWVEILGCGMMRPEVLRAGQLDPSEYQGFAFGIGIERIAMRRHQINDIRLLVANEETFLRQF